MAKTSADLNFENTKNWFKLGIALHITKEGLSEFVLRDCKEIKEEVLAKVYTDFSLKHGTECSDCSIEHVLGCPTRNICTRSNRGCLFHSTKTTRNCPKNICNKFVDILKRLHRRSEPTWKNTRSELWCTEPFHLAKCFMPPDGYSTASTIEKVDFNGVINVIINNKRFDNKFVPDLSTKDNIAVKARDIGKCFRHSSDLSVSTSDFQQYMDVLIELLSDPKCLNTDEKAKLAVAELNNLKHRPLHISSSETILAVEDFTKEQMRRLQKTHTETINFLRSVAKQLKTLEALTEDTLDKITSAKGCAVEIIKQAGSMERRSLNRQSERLKQNAERDIRATGNEEKRSLNRQSERLKQNAEHDIKATGSEERRSLSRQSERLKQNAERDIKATVTGERRSLTRQSERLKQNVERDIKATGSEERISLSRQSERLKQNAKRDIKATGSEERKSLRRQRKKAKQDIKSTGKKERESLRLKAQSERLKLKRKATQESRRAVKQIKLSATAARQKNLRTRISESDPEQYRKTKADLLQNLIVYYEDRHKYLPISPLREENKASVIDFFVNPSIVAKELDIGPYSKEGYKTSPVTDYKGVLYQNGKSCKNIYLSSPAGTGKSSFLKRLTLVWCCAHFADNEDKRNFAQEDLDVLKEFDFLFLILLREVGSGECHIDEMIKNQILCNLALASMFPDDFIEEILHTERCLILIDGLDEWSHPKEKQCNCQNLLIPSRKARSKCSILTTTRPWKFDSVIEANCTVDKHLEMRGLSEESADELAAKALLYLNSTYDKRKSLAKFHETIRQKHVHKLKYNPLILLQLLCVWFAQGTVGVSSCLIYGNMLAFLFAHAEKRRYRSRRSVSFDESRVRKQASVLPKFLAREESCRSNADLIISLSKLAFDRLLTAAKEDSLVFKKSVVERYLDTSMLDICRSTGLLTQSNACRKLLQTESSFSFIHKSYQEFLAALYVCSEAESPELTNYGSQIFSHCCSVDAVLEFTNVFLFACGMNTNCANILAEKMFHIVAKDELTHQFRSNFGTPFLKSMIPISKLQKLIVRCSQESISNRLTGLNMKIHDVIIDSMGIQSETWECHKTVIVQSLENAKSLCIDASTDPIAVSSAVSDIGLASMTGLEKLFVRGGLDLTKIAEVMNVSSSTLQCVELWHLVLSANAFLALSSMPLLKVLSLLCVRASHKTIVDLMSHMHTTSALTKVSLNELQCSDHGSECSGFELNLTKHKHLEMLLMDKLHVKRVEIDACELKMCVVEWMFYTEATASLLTSLENASHLERLELTGTESKNDLDCISSVLPRLKALRFVRFRMVDFENRTLCFHDDSQLECIYLWRVTLSTHTFRTLMELARNLKFPFLIMLIGCQILAGQQNKFKELRNEILNSDDFEVTRDVYVTRGKEVKYPELYFRRAVKY